MDRIADLLDKTSRTFALSIPLLPEPTRRQVGIAYLLFRIADTFEDATAWTPERQTGALADFVALLRAPSVVEAERLGAQWAASVPIEHDGYLELLGAAGHVIRHAQGLDPAAREVVVRHAIRTSEGMADFVVRKQSGVLSLESIEELQQYCYTVAGIVGELSTELFVLGQPELGEVSDELMARAARFGEALQLVNILKDAEFDGAEGRRFLPDTVSRREIFELARRDLAVAAEYTNLLQRAGAARGIVAFCALPTRLAHAALRVVERDGPGSKISREELARIVVALNDDLDSGAPAVAEASILAT